MSELFVRKVKKRKRWGKTIEYVSEERPIPMNEDEWKTLEENIRQEIKKAKVFTPQQLAVRFGQRVSTIKTILKKLENENLFEVVQKSRMLTIYRSK